MPIKTIPKKQIPSSWRIVILSDPGTFQPWEGKEEDFQKSVKTYVDLVAPDSGFIHVAGERDLRHNVKVNAKGERYCPQGNKLKEMGVKSGVPDCLFFKWNVAIELKVDNNNLTATQFGFLTMLEGFGWDVYVSWSMDEVRALIEYYIKK